MPACDWSRYLPVPVETYQFLSFLRKLLAEKKAICRSEPARGPRDIHRPFLARGPRAEINLLKKNSTLKLRLSSTKNSNKTLKKRATIASSPMRRCQNIG